MKLNCLKPLSMPLSIIPLLGMVFFSTVSKAQDLEPRSYYNLPVGETFMAMALARAEGDLAPAPSSPIEDLELRIDVLGVGIARTFALAGSSAKVDFLGARTCYEGSAIFQGEFTEGRRCEYGDPKLKLTWNFFGAPALKMAEYRKWKQGLVVGASLLASIPVGEYTSDQIINAGTNRWMLRPGLGMSWRTGRWQWEFKTEVSFFEDNDDFFGGIKSEQDPLYAVNAHVIFDLRKGRWISLDTNYFWGGEGKKDGRSQDDRQDNARFGLTYSMPITQKQSIKLYYSEGVATRIGNDFDRYGISWLYRF